MARGSPPLEVVFSFIVAALYKGGIRQCPCPKLLTGQVPRIGRSCI
jgi:hypothetical protein